MRRRASVAVILLVLGFATAGSGLIAVAPGEVAVVRRLGRVLPAPWGPGLHRGWPFGVDRATRLRPAEVRRLEFGLVGPPGPLDAPGTGEYLTGDLNIVRARGVVQYRVADPIAFVLRADDRDRLLGRLTEASLARALASRGIDEPLQAGRAEVARAVRDDLSRSANALGLGVLILGVNLTDARPPVEVEPAFAEAQAALSTRDRRLIEARGLAGTLRPAAVAASGDLIDNAKARADRGLAMARGQSSRFLGLLAQAERSRSLTVRRLYRDALRDLLPKVRRKVLMTPDEPVDLGLFGPER